MNLVHSKDIYYIFRDVMRCLDPKVMNHGARTSYILYRMLQCMDKKYEMYELAEFAFLATLHDLGAYKTDYMKDQLGYEIDKKKISVDEPIRNVGTHTVKVKLHPKVTADLKVHVSEL